MKSFSKLVPQEASVIREGKRYTLLAEKLVIGDMIEVKFGDRIPADIRVIKSSGFKVCECMYMYLSVYIEAMLE